MEKYLFLDEKRFPNDVYRYKLNKQYKDKKWVVVTNYEEFVLYLNHYGIPDFVSFDHDIAESHYTPKEFWNDYEASKAWQESQVHKEKTGYECAEYLIKFCIENRHYLPEYYCHRQNPVGRDKINELLYKYINLNK